MHLGRTKINGFVPGFTKGEAEAKNADLRFKADARAKAIRAEALVFFGGDVFHIGIIAKSVKEGILPNQ